jgi:hypothetical protein
LFYFSDITAVSREVMVASQKHHISVPITDSTKRLNEEKGDSSRSSLGYVHIKKIQIAILLFKNRFTIYDLRLPSTTLNFAITFYRKS